jgi:WD40 repeat protein
MAFTPDSAALAVATTEYKEQSFIGRVTVWDVDSDKEGLDFKALEGVTVSGVAFGQGGNVLAYCANGVVHACRADTAAKLYEINTPDYAVGLTFSPDGKRVAVRGRNQQVRVCDADDGKELYRLGDAEAPNRVGAVFALAGPLAVAPEVRTLAFSADGQKIATAAGGTVRLWTAATGKEVPLSDGHRAAVTAAAVSPDGKTVVSWGADRTIRRWEAATGKPLGGFPLPPRATTAALSADGRTVAFAGGDGTIRLHETAGGRELTQLKGHPRGTAALTFSPDGKVLAERGGDGIIRLHDPAGGGEPRQVAAPAAGNLYPPGVAVVAAPGRFPGVSGSGMVFSPDGKLLATPASASSPDGRLVVAPAASARGRPGGTIHLIDVDAGKAVRRIEPAVPVVSYAFSPDGRVLATENADESVSLWEVASGKERARLGNRTPAPATYTTAPAQVRLVDYVSRAEPGGPAALAFSPDGRVLVARGPDRSVRAWDVAGGKEVGRVTGHEGRVETIAFAADGKTVASGSADTTVLVWDAAALRKDLPAPQTAELADGAADSLWADLAAEDAGKALRGVLQLAGDPRQAVPFLAERLKPAAPIDPQKLERWVADLESDRFAVRQEAAASLVKAGEQAVPALKKVLASQPTIETRLRVEGLLDKLTGGALTTEQLRLVRAVEALEKMGTAEARELLRSLAGGAAGALPTREAKAALDRGK